MCSEDGILPDYAEIVAKSSLKTHLKVMEESSATDRPPPGEALLVEEAECDAAETEFLHAVQVGGVAIESLG